MTIIDKALAHKEAGDREQFNQWFLEEFERVSQQKKAMHTPSLSIVASKGTLDWAYPPFILSTTAASLGWDVNIFFTFYGLELLKKRLDLKVTPVGNPAMPMKMPAGPGWFRNINWNIPNAVMNNLPGFEGMTGYSSEEVMGKSMGLLQSGTMMGAPRRIRSTMVKGLSQLPTHTGIWLGP